MNLFYLSRFISVRSTPEIRYETLRKWAQSGGVLIIGYEMYRNLTVLQKQNKKEVGQNKNYQELMRECLNTPGADLAIFDEGHLLQKPKSQNYKACNSIKTRRRIILTGTPLQNNLIEYYWMVSFVQRNVLGDLKSFKRLFFDPITAGQKENATEGAVNFMKRRSYVLQKLLRKYMQRVTNAIYKEVLPPKQEHMLFIRLSKLKIKLYEVYPFFKLSNRRTEAHTLVSYHLPIYSPD